MRIAIIGKDSYIGNKIKKHLEKNGHSVVALDTLQSEWKDYDFSHEDVIVHVAAIVHENAKKANEQLFYEVNTKLPYEVAQKAKKAGVSQFVFLSTMAVYGVGKSLPSGYVITNEQELNPCTLYGKSKLAAEKKLNELNNSKFRVSIVRPPNVYGKGCKGNYMNSFYNIATKLHFFPKSYLDSRQSMMYIDNLSELIRLIIESGQEGIFTPQDSTIPNTCELIFVISQLASHKMVFSKLLGIGVRLLSWTFVVKKLFGGVSYSTNISNHFDNKYQIISFEEGIKETFS